jgi:hypothetical protein
MSQKPRQAHRYTRKALEKRPGLVLVTYTYQPRDPQFKRQGKDKRGAK